jgi:polyphosphate kinase
MTGYSEGLLEFIIKRANLRNSTTSSRAVATTTRAISPFPNVAEVLEFEPQRRCTLPRWRTRARTSVEKADILLHWHQSFHHVTDLLCEAAIDPKVKSISMTLYRVERLARDQRAHQRGTQREEGHRAAELQARFDEEANIR